ncbi:hypothetical protein AVEN_24367-1 [Araneus ventricosus]|uniref:Uncharacterized protein n=1 Tax=Araneus ventricosus TaxID=182803 RepID=A0A4Y2HUT6_ARAVE|nr:hypothetical protein AVEN_24367-1 [Araneus ventricosus]
MEEHRTRNGILELRPSGPDLNEAKSNDIKSRRRKIPFGKQLAISEEKKLFRVSKNYKTRYACPLLRCAVE